MNKKRMMVGIVVLGITTLLASWLYAGGMIMGMGGGGSCDIPLKEHQQATATATTTASQEKVKCAYDGMEIDEGVWMRYEGKMLYFCTKEEMEKFKKDPQAYLSGEKKGTMTMTPAPEAQYTCPMHPEVILDKPGRCPKCGMNLEKK